MEIFRLLYLIILFLGWGSLAYFIYTEDVTTIVQNSPLIAILALGLIAGEIYISNNDGK